MRLTHPMLSAPIHIRENVIPVLVAEHPVLFRRFVLSLGRQAEGENGEFILSLDYEPLDCGEHLQVIRDYTALSVDNRKLQNRFQALLQSVVRDELQEQTDHLQQMIVDYLQTVITAIEYPISFSGGEYVSPLLKALKCQPVLEGEEPLEQLFHYLTLYHGLLKNQCFVLVGAHCYFSREELEELYRMAGYQKWRLLLLEPCAVVPLPNEEICLLDRDLCELRLESGGKKG